MPAVASGYGSAIMAPGWARGAVQESRFAHMWSTGLFVGSQPALYMCVHSGLSVNSTNTGGNVLRTSHDASLKINAYMCASVRSTEVQIDAIHKGSACRAACCTCSL